jgi:membrane associated rhomboid family serine protease
MSLRAVPDRPWPPGAVIALVAATAILSLAAAIGERWGVPLARYLVLAPALVWSGEVYRLFTWQLIALDPIGLLLGCWMLWRFGGDLARTWGPVRFLVVHVGFAVGTGAITCLLALAWPPLLGATWLGAWPVAEALLIAWALLFPDRELYLYFVVRVRGHALVATVVGGTLLFALFFGLAPFVPDFAAQALMLLFMADLPAGLRALRRRRRAPPPHLHLVKDEEPDDDGEPPPPKTPIWLN